MGRTKKQIQGDTGEIEMVTKKTAEGYLDMSLSQKRNNKGFDATGRKMNFNTCKPGEKEYFEGKAYGKKRRLRLTRAEKEKKKEVEKKGGKYNIIGIPTQDAFE